MASVRSHRNRRARGRRWRWRTTPACGALLLSLLGACHRAPAPTPPDASTLASTSDAAPAAGDATTDAGAAANAAGPCSSDMIYVDTMFCPKIARRCVDVEHEEPNHLTICHAFEEGSSKCLGAEEHRQFCIDKYEYPNREGAHPTWMLTWFQAQATCESKGKRLCWASEWTAACEGQGHTPFPYGWARDHDACNIDNFYIEVRRAPRIGFVQYSKDPAVREPELARLDQSVLSGSMKDCKSSFGVFDQPGNLDEWVIEDTPAGRRDYGQFAGLKGGAWGHVRNACRPMTTHHHPEDKYYFWGFRCCSDAKGVPAWTPPPCSGENCPVPAPIVEAHDFAPDPIVVVHPAGPSKTKVGRSDRKKPKLTAPRPDGAPSGRPAPAARGARSSSRGRARALDGARRVPHGGSRQRAPRGLTARVLSERRV